MSLLLVLADVQFHLFLAGRCYNCSINSKYLYARGCLKSECRKNKSRRKKILDFDMHMSVSIAQPSFDEATWIFTCCNSSSFTFFLSVDYFIVITFIISIYCSISYAFSWNCYKEQTKTDHERIRILNSSLPFPFLPPPPFHLYLFLRLLSLKYYIIFYPGWALIYS